ncbi:MAG: hypothetical protein U0X87_02170 [Anaerolineales bacterium]
MFVVFFSLMTWWSFSSIAAFTVAGERMPWLTYHMACAHDPVDGMGDRASDQIWLRGKFRMRPHGSRFSCWL